MSRAGVRAVVDRGGPLRRAALLAGAPAPHHAVRRLQGADIIKQRWWKDKVIHCSYAESKPQKFLKSLRSSNDCIRSQTEIPYMTGWTASEGGFMVSLLYDSLEETGADWDSVGPFFTGLTINQVRGHWFQSVLHL